jgi:hypothetical protein
LQAIPAKVFEDGGIKSPVIFKCLDEIGAAVDSAERLKDRPRAKAKQVRD